VTAATGQVDPTIGEAAASAGRADNLRVKEVVVGDGERRLLASDGFQSAVMEAVMATGSCTIHRAELEMAGESSTPFDKQPVVRAAALVLHYLDRHGER